MRPEALSRTSLFLLRFGNLTGALGNEFAIARQRFYRTSYR